MSKKHRNVIPDFSTHKPQLKRIGVPVVKAPPVTAPVQRAKPRATSVKSGRRGQ